MDLDYSVKVERARKAFATGRTKQLSFRKKQLHGMLNLLAENEDAICDALKKDLNRPTLEAVTSEIVMTHNAIVNVLDNIDEWAKDDHQSKDLLTLMSKVFIRKEPFGVCLVIASWNFPITLLLIPVISAIAAGNCVVMKPGECATESSMLMQNLIPKYLDNECFPVVILGPADSANLVNNTRFDHIFFTGGTEIGRHIMKAASQFLTPVVLELGGKNPCYIDETCNLKVAARRVCWGRYANAGQICLAPDYVLCKESLKGKFIEELKITLKEFYGSDPQKSLDFSRLINDRQMQRMKKLIESGQGKIVIGGDIDEKEKYLSPTVVSDVNMNSCYMQQEMFGPILLIKSIAGVEDAIKIINHGEKPLALYIFSSDQGTIDNILHNTSSGGVCVNDCVMHYTINTLPFGGVGNSGMGNYHGKFGFDAFTHKRAVLMNGTPDALLSVRYPPYSQSKIKQARFLTQKSLKSTGLVGAIKSLFWMVLLGIALAYVAHLFLK